MKNLKCFVFFLLFATASYGQSGAISATKTEGCAPLTVNFSYSGTNIQSYSWEFGNGSTSAVANPTVLYNQPGTYTVKLITIDNSGATRSITFANKITVVEAPVSEFSIATSEVCTNTPITFTNLSSNADSYLWDFGDGNTSTDQNPTYSYSEGGNYNVTLIAYSDFGCQDSEIKNNVVSVEEVQNPDIIASKTSACIADATIIFSSSKSYSSYLWDFGDGTTSTLASPEHTYSAFGVYDISLTITNDHGCSTTLSESELIQISPQPTTPKLSYPKELCSGSSATFSGNFGAYASVLWSFSDGFTSIEKSFERVFTTSGSYNVMVTVTNKEGCDLILSDNTTIEVKSAAKTQIDFGEQSGCVPFTVTMINHTDSVANYEWEINGEVKTGKALTYTFDGPGHYSVIANMTYTSGCERSVTYDSVYLVRDIENRIIPSEQEACNPANLLFELEDENVTSPRWYVNNKLTEETLAPELSFTEPGTYNISVSFINEFGCKDSLVLSDPIIIHPQSINFEQPDPIVTCQSAEVYFNGGVGKDYWQWDFGDGTTSTEENPVHLYAQPGTYKVSLKTNNKYGCEAIIDNYNTIVVGDVEAGFSYEVTDTSGNCPDFTVQFNSEVSGAQSYLWTIEGETFTEANPIYNFSTIGQTNVILTVWNAEGCSSSINKIIPSPWTTCDDADAGDDQPDDGVDEPDSVYQPIDSVVFKTLKMKYCTAPAEVSFISPKKKAKSWLWLFGDGTTSTDKSPRHTYNDTGTYYVDIVTYDANNQADTLSNFAKVEIGKPDVGFSYTQTANCLGTSVKFNNPGNGLAEWQWDFGNGQKSKELNPNFVYDVPGVYQVSLVATDSSGCTSKSIKNIIVGNSFSDFDYERNLCLGEEINIEHNLQGFDELHWDFGDGTIIPTNSPSHLYEKPGVYDISVQGISSNGCIEKFTLGNKVMVDNPKAEFEVSGNDVGCDELEITFNNLSNNADTFLWDFGNGYTSTQKEPKITFGPGKYDVSLIASPNGCADTLRKEDAIFVDQVIPDFSFEQEGLCLPAEVSFTSESINATTWLWDFGDGTTSTEENPVHIYNDLIKRPVKLTVGSANGCTAEVEKTIRPFLTVDFKLTDSTNCVGNVFSFKNRSNNAKSWFWNFGDGNTSTAKDPSHSYSKPGQYTVSLTATAADGCTSTETKMNLVTVQEVKVDFEVKIGESSCAPLVATFINKSANASKYIWSFGDNSTSNKENPVHIYSAAGSYDVKLIAISEIGCSDTLRITDMITATGPESKILVSDSIVCHPEDIAFDDISNTAVQWEWVFGDGNTSDVKDPIHKYSAPGNYTVSLTTIDGDGCQEFHQFDSIAVIPTPEAKFEVEKQGSCLPVEISITNKSKNLQNPAFHWDFADGTTSTAADPKHLYTAAGDYTVSLKVFNERLCTSEFQLNTPITVYDTLQLIEPDIVQLSVEDNEKITLNCEPYQANNFRYNVVYRRLENSDFVPFDTLRSANALTYADKNVQPEQNSYTYKLQSHVFCNDSEPIENLRAYKSIQLKSQHDEEGITLSWNHYEGHTFNQYTILRKQEGGSWQIINEVGTTKNTFTDTEDLCPGKYEYQVQAVNLDGTSFFSQSNTTAVEQVENVFEDQHVKVVRSTVVNNASVFTEWKAPEIGLDKVLYYEIYRATTDNDFALIDNIPAEVTSYYDKNVDVQSDSYKYKIKVINSCEISSKFSNMGSSILLKKETDNYINRIYWTPYEGWSDGVGKYLIQRKNEFGEWETVSEVDSVSRETVIDLSNEND